MYSKLESASKYIQYFLRAGNRQGHGIHSPFVFEFITKVLNDSSSYEDYTKLEKLRHSLLNDKRKVLIEDLGVGSVVAQKNHRTVASIAAKTVKPKKWAQLLYRMVKFYQPKTIIELGTSLAVTTGYLSSGNPHAQIFTLEGSPEVADIAAENLRNLDCDNVKLIRGNFDNTLPAILYQLPTVDFAFIDGNHRQEPTENYFHWLLPKLHNESILIFDDIHWSREMEQAWKNIKEHIAVRCTIDLFFIGIVFFRHEFREKQSFVIRW